MRQTLTNTSRLALAAVALILGFAFGGVRVLTKKLFPDKVFDRPEDVEIIRLNLK